MEHKYKSLIKDAGVFALGSVGSKLILFFLLPLYTNCLTTQEYGIAELVYSLEQLIMPCITLMISDAVIRFGMSRHEKEEDVARIALSIWIVSSIIVVIITPIFGIYRILDEWKWYLCLLIIANGLQSIGVSYLKAKGKNKRYVLINIVQTLMLAILNIILLAVLNLGIAGYLVANVVVYIVTAIIAMHVGEFFRDVRKSNYDKQLCKKMLRYSIPLVFNTTSWWLISFSDKFMIEFMVDAAALGIYTVATKIPSLVNVVVSVFSQAWKLSAIRENESSKGTTFYSNIFMIYSMVIFGSGILINTFIRPFMLLYVGDAFQEAWRYVPLLIVGAVFSAISTFYGSIYSATKRTGESMLTAVIAAVVNIVFNLILIPIIGVWGAIIGTVVSYFVLANIRLLSVMKKTKMQIDLKSYMCNMVILLLQAIFISINKNNIYVISVLVFILFVINNLRNLRRVVLVIRTEKASY